MKAPGASQRCAERKTHSVDEFSFGRGPRELEEDEQENRVVSVKAAEGKDDDFSDGCVSGCSSSSCDTFS